MFPQLILKSFPGDQQPPLGSQFIFTEPIRKCLGDHFARSENSRFSERKGRADKRTILGLEDLGCCLPIRDLLEALYPVHLKGTISPPPASSDQRICRTPLSAPKLGKGYRLVRFGARNRSYRRRTARAGARSRSVHPHQS